MGVFDDKKFEKLDWMTQVTETIDSELNSVLARLPDRLELDKQTIFAMIDDSYNLSISLDSVVRDLIRKDKLTHVYNLGYEEQNKITKCFEWDVAENLEVDLSTRTINGTIVLVKTISTFADEDLAEIMGRQGLEGIRNISTQNASPSRMNEIIELIGEGADIIKNKSHSKKLRFIETRMRQIFKNNEWRVRDTTLANKLGIWARSYIEHGNLASFTNFCKVKVMTHNNMPIYSIEEEV
jgi:hypothetical protein